MPPARNAELHWKPKSKSWGNRYEWECVQAGTPQSFHHMTLPIKNIAVLMGGPGSEREVSFATGKGVAKALRSLGADVTEVDVRGADFALPEGVELAFLALHGTFGEDGQVQQILEDRGVPYTGEDVAGSALAFDKIRSKEAFRHHGVPTPYWQIIT